jgi:hypothetical protein
MDSITVVFYIKEHANYVEIIDWCNRILGQRCWSLKNYAKKTPWHLTTNGSKLTFKFLRLDDSIQFKLMWL